MSAIGDYVIELMEKGEWIDDEPCGFFDSSFRREMEAQLASENQVVESMDAGPEPVPF